MAWPSLVRPTSACAPLPPTFISLEPAPRGVVLLASGAAAGVPSGKSSPRGWGGRPGRAGGMDHRNVRRGAPFIYKVQSIGGKSSPPGCSQPPPLSVVLDADLPCGMHPLLSHSVLFWPPGFWPGRPLPLLLRMPGVAAARPGAAWMGRLAQAGHRGTKIGAGLWSQAPRLLLGMAARPMAGGVRGRGAAPHGLPRGGAVRHGNTCSYVLTMLCVIV